MFVETTQTGLRIAVSLQIVRSQRNLGLTVVPTNIPKHMLAARLTLPVAPLRSAHHDP